MTKNRVPKRQRRTLHVSGAISAAELASQVEQHQRRRCVVVKGSPRFVRTLVVERVEVLDAFARGAMLRLSGPGFTEGVIEGGRVCFAGHSILYDDVKRIRIAWPIRYEDGALRVMFCGSELPRVGERAYLETLPRVVGQQWPLIRPRHVVFESLVFVTTAEGSS